MPGGDAAVRQGPSASAVHRCVDVAVEPAVDGVRAAGGERSAEQDRENRREAGMAMGRGDHHSDGGGIQQQDDA